MTLAHAAAARNSRTAMVQLYNEHLIAEERYALRCYLRKKHDVLILNIALEERCTVKTPAATKRLRFSYEEEIIYDGISRHTKRARQIIRKTGGLQGVSLT